MAFPAINLRMFFDPKIIENPQCTTFIDEFSNSFPIFPLKPPFDISFGGFSSHVPAPVTEKRQAAAMRLLTFRAPVRGTLELFKSNLSQHTWEICGNM